MTESKKSTVRLGTATCTVVYAPDQPAVPNVRDSRQATRLSNVAALVAYAPGEQEQQHACAAPDNTRGRLRL